MKAFGKTLWRLVYDPRDLPPEPWRWTDWLALVVLSLIIAVVVGFWI
jgi:hypothetical protein